MTRVWGGLKAVGGLLEMSLGGAGGAATSWTGLGAVVGGAAVVHGADVTSSGLTQLWTGKESPTFSQKGISKALQFTGVSKNKADIAAGYADATLTMAFSSGAGALRDGTFLKQPVITVLRAPAIKEGSNIVLGVNEHLAEFAKSVNGSTWEKRGATNF